jgi:hypothetical protein
MTHSFFGFIDSVIQRSAKEAEESLGALRKRLGSESDKRRPGQRE